VIEMRERSDRRRVASQAARGQHGSPHVRILPPQRRGVLDWDNATTWPDRVVPKRGAHVNIPFGKSVLLRSSPTAGVLGKVDHPAHVQSRPWPERGSEDSL
jgi:hypothetical protein